MPTTSLIRPVSRQMRWHWLDALRGLALLGILVVNVQQMFFIKDFADGPFGINNAETGVWSHWFLINSLFDLKFLTLFTFLFGFSFVLQKQSIANKGAKLGGLYARRLLALAVIGILHGAYLYYADVLFMYAIAGFLLLMCHKCSEKTLFQTGLILSAVSILLIFGLEGVVLSSKPSLLMSLSGVVLVAVLARKLSALKYALTVAAALTTAVVFLQLTSNPIITPATEHAYFQNQAYAAYAVDNSRPVLAGQHHSWPMTNGQLNVLELSEKEENALEVLIFRNGPSSLATELRMEKFFGLSIVGFILYFFWRIAGLFFLSAALASYGMQNIRDKTWSRIRTWSLALGILLTVFSTSATALNMVREGSTLPFASLLHDLAAYLICAFFVAQFYLWRNHVSNFRVGRWLASGGRMALSNYIGQSAVMAFIAGPTGFQLFGKLTHWQAFGLAIVVFVTLVTVSHFWLKHFKMGPLEKIWRSITYLSWNSAQAPQAKRSLATSAH